MSAGLFDPAFYLRRYPDIPASAVDPVAHFVDRGCMERREPNFFVESGWYLKEYGAAIPPAMVPALHYLLAGERLGFRPGPHYDPAWYRRAFGMSRAMSPLAHYLANRASDPHLLPSAELYAVRHLRGLRTRAGGDPIERYLESGAQPASADMAAISASGAFDRNHYTLSNQDVHAAHEEPLRHFCVQGWKEGRDPSLYFSLEWYARTNPAVARREINPLAHYVCEGERAGRRPVPYFDPAWYRRAHGVPNRACALADYLATRRQGRSPTPHFDIAFFGATYPELALPGRDVFMAFLVNSLTRDLDPSPHFSSPAYRRTHMPGSVPGKAESIPLLHFLEQDYR